jgi:hypothetical protein
MAARFLGEHGPEYLVPTYDRPPYLVKIVPTKMLSWHGVEWGKKYTENNPLLAEPPAVFWPLAVKQQARETPRVPTQAAAGHMKITGRLPTPLGFPFD